MTIAQYRNELKTKLSEISPDEGEVLADLLLCEALKVPRYAFYTMLLEEMNPAVAATVDECVAKLGMGLPVQYILGRCHFYGCEISVGQGCFIPRSDTETVARTALGTLLPGGRFADICAGSGCITLAILHEKPTVSGCALELSRKALAYTERNLKGKRAKVIRFDALDEDDYRALAESEGLFDTVVCNPPYIPTSDIPFLPTQVQYEPESALDGGEDGLRYYRVITSLLPLILKHGGTIVYEVGYDQADAVSEILTGAGYAVGRVKDMGGIERCVFGKKTY